jgi:antitoxin (DNA-binding transcriptional repressor) of toxin-antitoxin stability system
MDVMTVAVTGLWRGIFVYTAYARYMTEDAVPLPYEVQEMTTTEARKNLPELVNLAAYGHVTTVLTRDGKRLARIVPEEDAWVYSKPWQDMIRDAQADITEGRVTEFDTGDELLAHLEALGDEGS